VITVTLNAERDLSLTAQSLIDLRQSEDLPEWMKIEAVLIDGGSSDETITVAAKSGAYDRIAILVGSSIYEAMNHGAEICTGDYITFLNAGDHYIAGQLERLLLQAESILLSGKNDHVLVAGRLMMRKASGLSLLKPLRGRSPLSMPAYQPGLIYRREALMALPFDTDYKIVADYIQMKLMLRHGYRIIHYPLAITVFAAAGVSSHPRRRLMEAYSAAEKYRFGNWLTRQLALFWLSRGLSLAWQIQDVMKLKQHFSQ
jgi:glycosyltransferase involved in cell wall biosynthesis